MEAPEAEQPWVWTRYMNRTASRLIKTRTSMFQTTVFPRAPARSPESIINWIVIKRHPPAKLAGGWHFHSGRAMEREREGRRAISSSARFVGRCGRRGFWLGL